MSVTPLETSPDFTARELHALRLKLGDTFVNEALLRGLSIPSGYVRAGSYCDATGSSDSAAGWQTLAAYMQAQDILSPRAWYIDARGGNFLINWDGVTGAGSTSINNRYCVRFSSLTLTIDFTGSKILHGGDDYTEWSTVFWLASCKFRVIGGEFDYQTQPYFQGTITTLGADYIDITLESGAIAPGFTRGYSIQGYDSNRNPNYSEWARSAYTGTAFTISLQSGTTYRCSDISDAIAAYQFTTVWTTNSLVTVWGQRDGCEWFRTFNCEENSFERCRVNCAVDSFVFVILGKNFTMRNCVAEPRDKVKGLGCVHRGFVNIFNVGGDVHISNNTCRYNLDDAFAVHGGSFGRYISGAIDKPMSKVSSTSFDAFIDSHFWDFEVPAGSTVDIYDGDASLAATVVLVSSTKIDTYYRRYVVTVSSGSLPASMTNCIGVIREYMPRGDISHNTVEKCRGRAFFTSLRGTICHNVARFITNEAILVEPGRTNWRYQWQPVQDLLIQGNELESACSDYTSYYPAAIFVRATNFSGTSTGLQVLPNSPTSETYPFSRIRILDNDVRNAKNMGVFVGGVDGVDVLRNHFQNCATSGAGATSEPWVLFVSCLVAIDTCKNYNVKFNTGTYASVADFVKVGEVSAGKALNGDILDNRLLEA